jgi:hypothetical protein
MLHIRLENGLERPCGRSRPVPRHLESLVVADAFVGKLTRGSFKTIPATEETTNTQRFEENSWLPFLDIYRTMCLAPQPDFRRVWPHRWRELINNAVGRLAWAHFGAVSGRPSRRVDAPRANRQAAFLGVSDWSLGYSSTLGLMRFWPRDV